MFLHSMELYKKSVDDQKKLQSLERRQQKLAMLLFEESRQYELEMTRQKYRPSSHRAPLEELKSVNYELKRREEENRSREVELKLYHKWRMDHPAVRDVSHVFSHKYSIDS